MNRSRRKRVRELLVAFMEFKEIKDISVALSKANEIYEELEKITDEEQDALDNMPENLAWSSRADDITDNLDNLNDALCDLSMIISTYEDESAETPWLSTEDEARSFLQNLTNIIER